MQVTTSGFVVRCAWCGRYLSGDVGGSEVSHGICPRCAALVLLESGVVPAERLAAQRAVAGTWDRWRDDGGEG